MMISSVHNATITKGDEVVYESKEGTIIHDYGNGSVEVQFGRFQIELLNKGQVHKKPPS